MKAGMIKKSKASSRIDRTDIPFEAPMHWAWLRLCDIGRLAGGMTPSKSRAEYWGGSVMWLSPKDIKANEVSDSQLKITEKGLCDTRLELFPAGSLFIVARSGILKRTFPVAINRSPSASNQDLKILVPFLNGIERYLQVMFSGLTEFILKNLVKTGTTVQSLKYSEFESQPFPLPPLPEQHRIVAKVDELMSLCDRLEANRNARESTRDRLTKASYVRLSALHTSDETFRTHTRFTLDALPAFTARVDQIEQLRQTILNLAARGKLVEQDPTDEPAGDLMKRIATARLRRTKVAKIKRNLVLRSVSTNNMPYDLPESWRWAYFGSIADFSAGRTPPRKNTSYWNTGEFPWITIADMVDGATVTLTKETVSDRARTDVFKCEPVASGTMIMSFKLTIGKIARLGIPSLSQ